MDDIPMTIDLRNNEQACGCGQVEINCHGLVSFKQPVRFADFIIALNEGKIKLTRSQHRVEE
jgi:hypothetical protein